MSDDDLKPKRRYLARRRGPYETALASMRSKAPDPEGEEVGELVDQVVNAQAQAKAGEPRQLDPNFDLVVRVSMQDKAKALLEKALKNPKSDAAKIVYVWVLNAVATMEKELSPQGMKMLGEERSRHSLLTQIAFQRGEIGKRDTKLREAKENLNRSARSIGRARTLATVTGHLLDEGKPVDMRGVCRQIAEMVGLCPPPEFTEGGRLNWELASGRPRETENTSDDANGRGDEREEQ